MGEPMCLLEKTPPRDAALLISLFNKLLELLLNNIYLSIRQSQHSIFFACHFYKACSSQFLVVVGNA